MVTRLPASFSPKKAKNVMTTTYEPPVVDNNRAACKDKPTEWFFLPDPKDALECCRGCPQSQACCEAADRNEEEWGVWGGVQRSAARHIQARQRLIMEGIWSGSSPVDPTTLRDTTFVDPWLRAGRLTPTAEQLEARRILMEAAYPKKVSPLKKEHGSRRAFRAGCRCDECCDAQERDREAQKIRRAAKKLARG